MDNDISVILPTSNQEEHYIGVTGSNSKPVIEEEPDYIYESTTMPRIFFAKRSMKLLLDDRTAAFQKLNLKLKNTNLPKEQKQYRAEAQEIVMNNLVTLLAECPSAIDNVSVVHIHDCEAVYSFFSSDGRFVPLCKLCNTSAYILTRIPHFKINCCNPSCKRKILHEGELKLPHKTTPVKKLRSQSSAYESPSNSSSMTQKSHEQKNRTYSKRELEMIKKTALKVTDR